MLDPELPIVDAHHHLWSLPDFEYLAPQFQHDLATGHRVEATVYVECLSNYLSQGPESLQAVGETRFVVEQATSHAQSGASTRLCEAIVGWADLSLGAAVEAVLHAHADAGGGRFRGLRARPTWHEDTRIHPAQTGGPHFLLQAPVLEAVRALGRLDLSLDLWLYHTQLEDVLTLADQCPETRLVLNHCGGPLGVGPYEGQRSEVFLRWRQSMRQLAALPQLRVKLGGLAMPRMGFALDQAPVAPGSECLARLWAPYLETCIELLGAERCMFESNFPVDQVGCSYGVLWNTFKRVTQGCSASERLRLFAGTATDTYRLTPLKF
ncbi:amidohydrolase family protein [Curvibacter cyanobacteriorum]|uniref:amidohydrolase family protein n=1 Tax=Curvibacter cyanobacteriorum TaxID=3026422 RepID=UPI003081E82C